MTTRTHARHLNALVATIAVLFTTMSFSVLTSTPAHAVARTWVGSGSGGGSTNFNLSTNWSPSGTPTAADDLTITPNSDGSITLTGTITVNSININPTSGSDQVSLNMASFTLTINGNLTVSEGSSTSDFTLGMGTGSLVVGGTTSLGNSGSGPVWITGGGTSASSIVFRGNVTFGGNFDAQSGSTRPGRYVFDAVGAQSVTNNSGGTSDFSSIEIGGTNTPTVTWSGSGTINLNPTNAAAADLTIKAGSTLNLASETLNRTTGGGTFTMEAGSTLQLAASNFPTNFSANTLNSTSTVNYNGTGAQTITAVNYGNLTSSSTGGRTLASSGTIGVATTFTPGTNAYTITGSTVNFNGSGAQTIPAFNFNNLTSSSTGGRTLASSGTVGVAGTFTPGANAYTITGSTVNFNGSGSQTIPAFAYESLTSSSSGARTLASSGTIGVAATLTPGTNGYTNTGSTIDFNGSVSQTVPAFSYNNLTSSSSGARVLASSGTVGIAGTWTQGTNAYTATGSTVNFNGTGAQTVPLFSYHNLSISGAHTSNSVTLASGTIGVGGTLAATATFTSGGYVVTGNTIDYVGSGPQTIGAFGYNDLSNSGNGDRTLASSGTIGVAGVFSPGGGSYTIAGSTIDFNGSGSQTIPAFSYNNLTSSSSGTRTVSGTIGVAGAFSPGANGFTVTGSTFDFNGSGSQTIPAFAYDNLTSSSTGARVLAASGVISVTGAFTPGANTYTVTGSTVRYGGAAAQTSPAFAYHHLDINNAAGVTLAGNASVGGTLAFLAGNIITGANTLTTANGTPSASQGTGWVAGNLVRTLPAGSATTGFEIGDATLYTPVIVDMTGLAGATDVTAYTTTPDHPSLAGSGLDAAKSVNRYWTLTPAGSPSFTSYDATFNFAAGDVDGGADPNNFVVGRYSAGSWNSTGVGTRTATSTQATAVTSFSDFAIAEADGALFLLNVSIVGSGTVARSPNQLSYAPSTVVTLTPTAGTGYTFTGWSGDATGSDNPLLVTMDAPKNITATFTINTYSATVTAGANGSAAKSPDQPLYDYGTTVTFTATPDPGYNFTGWTGDTTTSTNPLPWIITQNRSIQANFAINTYTLNAVAGANGAVTKSPDQGTYDHFTEVTVTAIPNEGYNFVNWTGDTTSTSPTLNLTMKANRSMTANFAIQTFTVSATASPGAGGSVTKAPNQATYNFGAPLTLTANTNVGYTFTGWTGDTTTATNPLSIFVRKNWTLTANYAISTYALTTNVSGTGTITRSPDLALYDHGTVVTLTGVPGAGNAFNRWTGDILGRRADTTITMNGARTVTGHFVPATLPFTQDFNASSTLTDYHLLGTGALTSGKIDSSGSTGSSSVAIVANGGSNALRVVRDASSGAVFTRSTNLTSPAPTAMVFQFNLQKTTGVLGSGAHTGILRIGQNFSIAADESDANTFARLGITAPSATAYRLRNLTTSANSPADITANTLITLVLNKSGAGLPYTVAGAGSGTAANDAFDVWAGTTLVFAGISATTSSAALTDFEYTQNIALNTNPMTVFFDNFNVFIPNQAPVLAAIGNPSGTELAPIIFTASATDPDVPAQTLTFSLDAGAPAGATIAGSTGEFSWVPTEAQGPGTYPVTVRVTDSGTPAFSDFEAITITVAEANQAPVLAAISDITTDEGVAATFTASAIDGDLPPQTLTYSLDPGFPPGATINPSTGAFSWTPGPTDGGNVYPVTVRATDNGPGALSDTRSLNITVNAVNSAPVLAAIGPQSVDEGSTLTFTASAADLDVPANNVTLSMDAGAPAAATFNPGTGEFSWTTTETDAPGVYNVTIRATDDGLPPAEDFEVVVITVNEVNVAPVLAAIADATVDEGQLLSFTASATDSDLPAQNLTYSLVGPPAGAAINPTTGAFTWTPGESFGGGVTNITVRATDNGPGNLFDSKTFAVTVNETNVAPELATIGNQTANEGQTVGFTAVATDADDPVNTLAFTLDPGAPVGASINPTTGAFTWATSIGDYGVYPVTVRVTDNGTPVLDDSETFNIIINQLFTVTAVASPGAGGSVALLPNQPTYPNGSSVTLTANPNVGYTFTGWTGDTTTATNPLPLTVHRNWSLTANFVISTYALTVNTTGNGTVAKSPDQALYDHGTVVTLTATPATGYQFFNWTGDATGTTNPTTVTMTAARTVTANFVSTTLPFVQNFNASSTISDYLLGGTGSLTDGKWNAFGTSGTTPWSIASSTLEYSRTSSSIASFSRSTDLSNPAKGAIITQFNLQKTAGTSTGTSSAVLRIGSGFGTANSDESDANTFAKLAFDMTGTTTYSIRNPHPLTGGGTSSVGSPYLITVVANKSGAPYSYTLPGGGSGTVQNDKIDVWTNTILAFDEMDPASTTPSLTDLKYVHSSNSSTLRFDNFNIFSTVNNVPVLAAIGNQTVTEGQTVGFTASATDEDVSQTLTFSLDAGAPAGASIHPTTGAFSWATGEPEGGVYPVTVRVTDNGSPALSDFETIQITVNEINEAPVLAAIGDRTTDEGLAVAFTASASDVDLPAQTLAFSLDAGFPAGATINPSTGAFSWTPDDNAGGNTFPITIRVTDNGSPALDDFETITVTVNDVNNAPVLAAIGAQNVSEGATVAFTASATDQDIPANTVTLSMDAGAPASATFNPGTGAFSWVTTEADGPGTYNVTIRATDDGTPVLEDFETIVITVAETNLAPELAAIGAQSVNEGQLLTFTASATDADLPANTLTYSLDAGFPAGAAIDPNTGVFTWTPDDTFGGTVPNITVRVTDNGSGPLDDFETIAITVVEINQPPVLAAIADPTVNEGQIVSFTASATDGDLPPQTLTFSLDVGAPVGASINPSTGQFTWTTNESTSGVFPVTVRVTDNGAPAFENDFQLVTITVNEINTAPFMSPISNKFESEGSTLNVNVGALTSDDDLPPQTLTYSLDAGFPTGATINPGTGQFSWTPGETHGGLVHPVTVRVTDNGVPVLDASRTFTVTVDEINENPVLAAIGNQTVDEGFLLTFTATATDPDLPANTLSYTLDGGAPAGAAITTGGVFTWTPTEAQGPGNYSITVRVTDNGVPPKNDFEVINVQVNDINNAPELAAIGGQTVDEGNTLTFTASATDQDTPAQTLTFTLDAGAPAGASIHPSTGDFSWTTTEADGPNTYSVTVRVTDNGMPAANDFETITITVNEVNNAPVLLAIGDKSVDEGSLLTFDTDANDSDTPAQTLTFSLDSPPAGASIDGSTGVFTWTPSEAQGPGTHNVTVRVTDNGTPAQSDFETILVTVADVNNPPVLAAIGNQSVDETQLLSFTATANDTDIPTNTLTFTLDAGAPAGASITTGGLFTWTPSESDGGNVFGVTVRVTDNGVPVLDDFEAITITVNDVNIAPVLASIGGQTVDELALLSFTATATDDDVPPNGLTFSLDAGSPAGAAITAGGVFTWTPSEAQGPGTYPVTVRVTDDGVPSLDDSETITITVNELNIAPVLAAIGNQTVDEGTLLSFTAVATDADLPANTLTFTLDAGSPAGAAITAGGLFTWTPTEAQGPGSYPVTVRVTDDGVPALDDFELITITVNDINNAPVLAAVGDQTVNEASLLTFTALATDSDMPANALAFTLDAGAPAGASITGGGLFTWTPAEADGPGVFTITVRVTDDGAPVLDDFETITVTVADVNNAPVLAAIGDQTVAELALLSFTANATDTDVPAQGLTFSLDAGAPAGAAITAGGLFTWTPSEAQGPGTYPVTVRVTDDGVPALDDFEAITITVNEVNVAPVLASIGDQTVDELVLLSFTASATDSDTPPNGLTFSLDAGSPAGAAITAAGLFTWTPSEAQGPGTYPVTVRVTDDGVPALDDFEAITITVNEVNVAPVLASIGGQTVDELALLSFTASATDSDTPPNGLTFSLDAGSPAGAAITAAGLFTWTPSEAQGPGSYPVTVRVTDDGVPALDDFEAITITVNELNIAPVLAAVGDQTVDEGTLLSFTALATDADLPANTLTFTLDAGSPAGAAITAAGLFTWTPSEAQGPGSYPVTVRVTDDGVPALDDFELITITVNDINNAPVLAVVGDQSILEGSLLSFTATATDSDIPANSLTFSLDAGSPAGAAITAGGLFTWTPSEAQGPGSYPVTVRVKDDGVPAADDFETITITVSEVNEAPVLAAIGDQTVDELVLLSFTASATDTDVPPNGLTFSLDAGSPAGAAITAAGLFTWTPDETQGPGSYPVTVRVTDDGVPALDDFEAITITVNEVNVAPVLASIGDQTVDELVLLSFTASATDSDTPPNGLTFSLDAGSPAGAAITAAGLFTWTPSEAQGPGSYPVTVRVTDDGVPALDDFEAITITVNEVNVAPVLASIGGQTVDELALLSFTASATDSDTPPNGLTFSLDAGSPAGAAITAAGLFTWTPSEAQGPGSYPVTVRVTDDGVPALDDFEAITITVNELNIAPVLAAVGDQTVDEGTLLSFTALATDADLPANTLTFTLDAGSPAGAAITAAGLFTWTPSEAQGPGSYPVTVRVTDDGVPALDDFELITITVNDINNAPVLAVVGDQSILEGSLLSFTATATDSDIPANGLTFTLDVGSPAGAAITAGGLFTWTPSEAQGPGSYPVTVRVTDDGVPAADDFETITITVSEVNEAPVLAAIGDQTVDELVLLSFTAAATDTDVPPNGLTFSLDAGSPAGAAITAGGLFTWTPSEAQGPGTYPLTVRVTDDGVPALDDFEAITITVNEVNVAPVLASIGDQTVDELVLLSFTASATDSDTPPNGLTFSLDAGSPAGAAITAAGLFTWTPSEAQGPGTYPVTVRVTDDGVPALDDFEAITITVNEVNVAPVLASIGGQTVDELALLSFTASATDSDTPPNGLTFSLDAGSPAGAAITAAGLFTWTPSEAQGPGSYPVTVRVTDDGVPALDDFEAITITVNELNIAPVLAAVGDQTVDEGTLLSFTALATDADLPANTLTFTLDAGSPAGAAITAAGLFTWTPSEAQGPGSYPVTVRVTDDGVPALDDFELITITVNDINNAPVLAVVGDQSILEGSLLSFTATATDSDIPANGLTFTLDVGSPAGAAITAGGVFTWTPSEAQGPGSYPVTVRVTDDGVPAADDFETITITVSEVNEAPVLAAIGDQTVDELVLLSFTASATDTDVPPNGLTFSLDAGAPAGAAITAAGLFTWTPDETQGPGSYPVTVRVTDDGVPALDDFEAITITVNNVNVAPVLASIGNQTVDELVLLSFTASATDSDLPANGLTFSLDAGSPAGAAITAGGVFTWTPTEAQGAGSYPVTVRVTDDGVPALDDFEAITITVNEVNLAPVVDAISDKFEVEGATLNVTASASDADLPANVLTFSLDAAPVGASITAGGAFTWTPSEAQGPGTYLVTVRATDDGSPALFDTEDFNVEVSEINEAPVLAAIGNQTVDEGTLLSFTALATDTDLPANALTFSLDAGSPAGAAITAGGLFTWTPSEAQGPGSYPVTVRVTDDGVPALDDFELITITVNDINNAPVLAVVGDQSILEGTLLSFTATATDSDIPANSLTFTLDVGSPAGAAITAGGLFTWTPSEAQGPGRYPVTVRVTDDGVPVADDFETITITVSEVNEAPVLAAIGDQTVDELVLLSFTASATDTDVPPNGLTFSLDAGAPAGAAITAAGLFTWTPSEAQGPGSYPVTVRVTDDGVPALDDFEAITITVNNVNVAPVLAAIGNQNVDELVLLSFTATATDSDLPANGLTFSLDAGSPAGAAITAGGVFTWTPTEAQGAGSYPVTVRVTDDGVPALDDFEAITITVNEVNLAPVVDAISDKFEVEGATLNVTASASDADLPANVLTFSLDAAPVGASITAGGAFTWTPSEAQGPGTYLVTVRATDDGSPALFDTEDFNVEVSEINEAPVLAAIGNQTVDEGTLLSFTALATDTDLPANALTFSLDAGSPAGAAITAGGLFTWTPSEAQGPGSYPVTVRVTDDGVPVKNDFESITITVNDINNAPVLAVVGDQSILEGTLLSFTATATDSDIPANGLTFSLDAGSPAGAAITAGGLFTWTPSEAQGPGSYPVTVRVTDDGVPAADDFETITITVSEVNEAPVLAAIGDQTVDELVLLSFTASATDTDVPPNGLTFSLDAGSPAGAAITAAGLFTWTPSEAQGPGTYPLTVRVTDDGVPALDDFEAITITVNNVNVAPVLAAIGNQNVDELVLLSFTATATDSDLPANGLTFSLDAGSPAGAAITAGGVFTWTPTEAQGAGSYPVTVRVTDDGVPALDDFEAITITVNEVNLAPVVDAISDKFEVEGATLNVTASASDADLPANVLTFSLDAAPVGASITAGGAFTWTPSEAQGPGTYLVTVRATDDGSPALFDTEDFNVEVSEINEAPVLAAIGNQTVDEGTLLSFTALATDTDLPANALTFSLDAGSPAGAAITAGGLFTWTPSEAQGPGSYPVTVRVKDDGVPALDDFELITITVNDINNAPVLAVVGDQSILEGSLLSFTATATDSDIPANSLTFSLDAGSPAGAAITAGGLFTWTPSEAQGPGSYPVTVRVTDDGVPAADDFETITITVSEVNEAPVLAAIGDQTVDELVLLSFTASATDTDVPPNGLTFSLDAGAPVGAVITAAGLFTWTPSEAQGPGSYPVTVRVTDDGVPALDDFEAITITVNEVNVAPVLASIGGQTVAEGSSLNFTATATDADLPANSLTFTLDAGAPVGASITAAGAFSWATTESDGPNTYSITVRVADSGSPSLDDSETLTITVAEGNLPPVLATIGNQGVAEGSLLSFTATATDADVPAQVLTFSLDPGSPAGAVITAGGLFTWTPSEAQGPGSYPVTVRVTDDGVLALDDFEAITITVSELNVAPVLAAIGNQTVDEGTLLSLTAVATDADLPANALTFSLDAGSPAGAAITAGGLFTWTPSEAQGPGSYPVTVRVTDDGVPALDDFELITITVNDINNAPVLAVVGGQAVAEGSLLSFTATATDSDIPANNLTFSLDAGSPAGAAVTAGGLFTWTPSEAQGPGSYPVTVRVTDDGVPAADDFETITITVSEVNEAPVLAAIGDQTVDELVLLSFTASATDTDVPPNGLTFSLDAGAPAGAAITAGGLFTWTPSEAQGPGTYPVAVRVTDDGVPALDDFEAITITVNEVNVAPVLASIGGQTVAEGSLLNFTATATDADLPANSLTFTLDAGAPVGASITSAGAFSWATTESDGPNTYSITVRVADNGSPSLDDSETLTITVAEGNVPPVLAAIGNQNVAEGSLLSFTATATDADVPAQVLTFSLDAGSPAGASITAGGAFSWTPIETQGPGSYPVTVRVTDNGTPALSGFETFTILVGEVNVAPVLAAIGNQTVTELVLLTFTATATDTDLPAQALTFSLDAGAPAGAAITGAGVFTWTPNAAQGPGSYPVTVRVADNGSPTQSATETITITVDDAAPVNPVHKLVSLRADSANGTTHYPIPGWNDPWVNLVGSPNAILDDFIGTTTSGWAGNGTTGSPYRVEFTGRGEQVVLPAAGVTALQTVAPVSAEVWFKPSHDQPVAGEYDHLIEWLQTGSSRGMTLAISEGKLYTYISDAWVAAGDVLPDQWYHAVVAKGTGGVRVYLNGVLTYTNSEAWNGRQDTPIGIGASPWRFNYGTPEFGDRFRGAIGEVTIWRGMLDGGQVSGQFANDQARYLPVPALPTPQRVVSLEAAKANGSAAYAVPGAAGPWVDLVAPAASATLRNFNGSTTSGWRGNGTAGNPYRLKFDGTNDVATINAGAVAELQHAHALSAEMWFQTPASLLSASKALLEWYAGNGGTDGMSISTAGNQLQVYTGGDGSDNVATLAASTWYHVIVTKEPGEARVYLNGDRIYTSGEVSFGNQGSEVVFGASIWNGPGTYSDFFNGSIGQAHLWLGAVTDPIAASSYATTAGQYQLTVDVETVPVALALAGMRPNPARGNAMKVAFSLPSSEPARLEMVDVSGRVVREFEVGRLGAGHHVVDLSNGRDISAGMYWVRLTQSRRTLTMKATVIR